MYRTVFTDIWRQRWFEELSVDARYLYLYFWTNPETRPNGVISTSKRRVMFDTRLDGERLEVAALELAAQVCCLWEHGVVSIEGFAESQGSGSKWQKAVEKANQALTPEVLAALQALQAGPSETPARASRRDTDTPSIPHPTLVERVDTPSMPHPPGTGAATATGPATPSGAKAPSGAAPSSSPNSTSPVPVQGSTGGDGQRISSAAAGVEPGAQHSRPEEAGGGTAPRLGANGEDSSPPEVDGGAQRPPRGMTGRSKTEGKPQADAVLEAVVDTIPIPYQVPAGDADTPSIPHPTLVEMVDAPSVPHPGLGKGMDTPSMPHPPGTGSASAKGTPAPVAEGSRPESAVGAQRPSRGMTGRRKTGGNPQVDGVLEAIEGLWGHPIVHWAKEAREVKAALAGGYQPQQVVACWKAAQESPRWQGRWMPLAYLVEDLGEFMKNGGGPLRKWMQQARKEDGHGTERPGSIPSAEEWRARRGRW